MGRVQIIEKLDNFLENKRQFTSEADITYFLIEIRKFLEHSGYNEDTKIIKFYSDWIAHTKKDRVTPEIKAIVGEMFKDIVTEISTGWPTKRRTVTGFVYMEVLKREIDEFLSVNNLPKYLVIEDNWLEFIKLLVGVLSDQPIIDPIPEITSINFLPTAPGFVICRVDFKQPLNGYSYYEYKNVF